MDIFHHFHIINSSLGFGLSNLTFGEMKCLFLFIIFAVLVRLRIKFFFHTFYYIFKFIDEIVYNTFSEKNRFLTAPLVCLFLFLIFSNLYGLLPFQFSFNAHLIVTICWALIIFLYGIIVGITRNSKVFFHQFVPSNIPKILLIIMVPLELISFIIKPISLSLRLFINVMVGHILMTVAESFAHQSILGTVSSFIALIFLHFMEFFISILQSYIFVMMSVNFLKGCLEDH